MKPTTGPIRVGMIRAGAAVRRLHWLVLDWIAEVH